MKSVRDIQPGDRTTGGWTYISEPAEQPDGSWVVVARAPSGHRRLLEFEGGDVDAEVEGGEAA